MTTSPGPTSSTSAHRPPRRPRRLRSPFARRGHRRRCAPRRGPDRDRRSAGVRRHRAPPNRPLVPAPISTTRPAGFERAGDEVDRARNVGRRFQRRVHGAAMRSTSIVASATSSSRSIPAVARIERLGRGLAVSPATLRSAPDAAQPPPANRLVTGFDDRRARDVTVQPRLQQERQQAVLREQAAGQCDSRRLVEQFDRPQRRLHQIAELLRGLLDDLRRCAIASCRRKPECSVRAPRFAQASSARRRARRGSVRDPALRARARPARSFHRPACDRPARGRTISRPASRSRRRNPRRPPGSRVRRRAANAHRVRRTRSIRSRDQDRAVTLGNRRAQRDRRVVTDADVRAAKRGLDQPTQMLGDPGATGAGDADVNCGGDGCLPARRESS